ncbi:hypothetical protein JAAARDRAFT_337906 [Jaapia argillacea MUCL 33604]|uniref:C2H2-type domain-containing protein n=1 Tax=Jaapia argillacea MUCL 33604 TaxID=933084 RepID=A0A067PNU4_9AGAM|nr:hypothetical protein JAAARDRAFT_337906 [Jaapia argillacea MUCL 33604]
MPATDYYPARCTICRETFSRHTAIPDHVREKHPSEGSSSTRLGSKSSIPAGCTECDKTLTRYTDLPRHIDGVHRKTAKIPCQQPGCTYKDSQQTNVNEHYNIHHAKKLIYPCEFEECTQRFVGRSMRLTHYKNDHGEQPQKKSKRGSIAAPLPRPPPPNHPNPSSSREVIDLSLDDSDDESGFSYPSATVGQPFIPPSVTASSHPTTHNSRPHPHSYLSLPPSSSSASSTSPPTPPTPGGPESQVRVNPRTRAAPYPARNPTQTDKGTRRARRQKREAPSPITLPTPASLPAHALPVVAGSWDPLNTTDSRVNDSSSNVSLPSLPVVAGS